MEKISEFFFDNFKYFLIGIISVLVILILISTFKIIRKSIIFKKKTRMIITGVDSDTKVKGINEKKKNKKIKKKHRKNIILNLYKEYVFFDGSKAKFFEILIIGYLVFYVVFVLLSRDFVLSAVFALAYFDLFYIFIDKKNEKNRKKYIKSFSLALRTLTASVEAGNSFPEALSLIIKRDTIGRKIRSELAYLSNNLKNNKSLEEALEEFWKRNSMFQEFSMFVIVMQFYAKKGGEGLGKILLDLERTLENKVESYSEIDTELGIHKTLMNILIYGYFAFLLVVKLFMPEFFVDISQDQFGIVKALGSVALLFFGTVFFKNMVRSAAEG